MLISPSVATSDVMPRTMMLRATTFVTPFCPVAVTPLALMPPTRVSEVVNAPTLTVAASPVKVFPSSEALKRTPEACAPAICAP
jgi:hypothetical protein